MSVLGWFLAVGGIVGVIFALRMMMKLKKMQTVPFRAPSELVRGGASAADANGLVSTEGQALVGDQPLVAPLSGQACLAYQIVIERKWEKHEETENGTQKKTGSDKVHTEFRGSRFQLSDGTGAVTVDVTKEPDAELETSHSATVKIGTMVPSTLVFGQMQVQTPILPRDSHTTAFVATERVLKPGTLYALGALSGGTVTAPTGLGKKLTLSSKGRSALMATTKRNMVLGYALGGVLAVGGTTLGILGPAPKGGCGTLAGETACTGRIYNADGDNLTWKIDREGTYKIVVSQPKVKNPIDSTVAVFDATGKQVAYNDGGSPGANAVIEHHFQPGTYRLNVRDFARHKVSGGYGYALSVALTDTSPVPTAVGSGGASK